MSLATGSGEGADERVAEAAEDFCRDLVEERRLGRVGFCELGERPSRAAMAWSRARRCFFSSARMRGISKVGSPELVRFSAKMPTERQEVSSCSVFRTKLENPAKIEGFNRVLAGRKRARAGLVVRN